MSYRVDNITNINDVETQGQDSGEENCQADNGADRLSVMFPACQDPLLTKIYRGLPNRPCVASFFL